MIGMRGLGLAAIAPGRWRAFRCVGFAAHVLITIYRNVDIHIQLNTLNSERSRNTEDAIGTYVVLYS